MNEVKVSDKVFDLYIPYEDICHKIDKTAERMSAELKDNNPLFVVMLNGAFMFASELMQRLNFPAEICFVKLSSYTGTQSSGKVNVQLGLTRDIKERQVVIVEDIVETGLTMRTMLDKLYSAGAKDVRITSLFVKPHMLKHDVKVDYPVMEIGDDFIVGFGLDYNQYGRNLKSIYKLKN